MTAQQKKAVSGAGLGALKHAIGAFLLGFCMEVGAIPDDVGPYTTMVLMFLFSQVAFVILTPAQWRTLLGK